MWCGAKGISGISNISTYKQTQEKSLTVHDGQRSSRGGGSNSTPSHIHTHTHSCQRSKHSNIKAHRFTGTNRSLWRCERVDPDTPEDYDVGKSQPETGVVLIKEEDGHCCPYNFQSDGFLCLLVLCGVCCWWVQCLICYLEYVIEIQKKLF